MSAHPSPLRSHPPRASSHSPSSSSSSSNTDHFEPRTTEAFVVPLPPSPAASTTKLHSTAPEEEMPASSQDPERARRNSTLDDQTPEQRRRPFSFMITGAPRWTWIHALILGVSLAAIGCAVVAVVLTLKHHGHGHSDSLQVESATPATDGPWNDPSLPGPPVASTSHGPSSNQPRSASTPPAQPSATEAAAPTLQSSSSGETPNPMPVPAASAMTAAAASSTTTPTPIPIPIPASDPTPMPDFTSFTLPASIATPAADAQQHAAGYGGPPPWAAALVNHNHGGPPAGAVDSVRHFFNHGSNAGPAGEGGGTGAGPGTETYGFAQRRSAGRAGENVSGTAGHSIPAASRRAQVAVSTTLVTRVAGLAV